MVAVAASVKKPEGYVTYIWAPDASAESVVNVAVAPLLVAPGVAEGMLRAVVVTIPADIAGKVTGIQTVDVAPTPDTPRVMESGNALLLAVNVRPLMVIVTAVVPVTGIIAPDTARMTF